MTEKVLTISIAAYNVERFIVKALDSICSENILHRCEVFVIDDGGEDGTFEIAKNYEKAYPDTFHAIHKDNGGWGSTVNYSIQHANGKYFKLLDGDDFFSTKDLESVVSILSQIDSDAVFVPYNRIDDKSLKIIKTFEIPKACVANKEYKIEDLPLSVDFTNPATIFKTSVLKENSIEITEKCFYTDNEFRIKAIAFCQTAFFIDANLYQYRIGREGQSVQLSSLEKHYLDNILVTKKLLNFAKVHVDDNEVFVNKYIKNTVEYQYEVLLSLNKRKEFVEFDKLIRSEALQYRSVDSAAIKFLLNSNYRFFGLLSALRRTRIRFAPKVRVLLNTFKLRNQKA